LWVIKKVFEPSRRDQERIGYGCNVFIRKAYFVRPSGSR
jgi:hypothetical protein